MFFKLMFLLSLKNIVKLSIISNTFSDNQGIVLIQKKNLINKNTLGFDERFPINNTRNCSIMHDVMQYFEKKRMIDILKDKNVSIYTKILLLQDTSIKPYNIFAGGLIDDFDFPEF